MMISDIMPEHRSLLDARQWVALMPEMCEYGAGKLRRLFLFSSARDSSEDYSDHGDADYGSHPADEHLLFPVGLVKTSNDFSGEVLPYFKAFKSEINDNSGTLIVLPPAICASSFERWHSFINQIAVELQKAGCPFAVEPDCYALEDRLFRDTPYHLNLVGRSVRSEILTSNLIQGLKKR